MALNVQLLTRWDNPSFSLFIFCVSYVMRDSIQASMLQYAWSVEYETAFKGGGPEVYLRSRNVNSQLAELTKCFALGYIAVDIVQ